MKDKTLAPVNNGTKIYSVKKMAGSFMTGVINNSLWKQATTISDFQYPWENGAPPPTTFRALHDNEGLYCLFNVTDPHVYLHHDTNDKMDVVSSSRAEIFFKADNSLDPYYCLEIDPLGRVLDYIGTYHRKFDFNWSWPAGHLSIHAERHKEGYTIQAAISKASLSKLHLLNDNTLQAGIFRGDCFPQDDGKLDFKWISWVKPDSRTPDFHIPSSFGLLRLE